jgi:hypothetical protein
LFVDDIALDESDELASANHFSFGAKSRLPYRPKEIDLQLQRRHTLVCLKCGVVGEAHGRVSDVAQHASMEGPGRICVPLIGDEFEYSRPVFRLKQLKTAMGAGNSSSATVERGAVPFTSNWVSGLLTSELT